MYPLSGQLGAMTNSPRAPFSPMNVDGIAPSLWLKSDSGTYTDGAVSFLATDKAYLTLPSNASLQTGNIDFEIGAWVNMTTTTGVQTVVAKYDIASKREYLIWVVSGVPYFRVSSNGVATVDAVWGSALSTSTWYFIRAYHDATADKIYIQVNNGTPVSYDYASGLYTSTGAFTVGSLADGSYNFNGSIDSLYFTKAISSTAEATALYNSGAGRNFAQLTAANGLDTFKTNLTSWWNFDELLGTRYDVKGTNHLTPAATNLIQPEATGSERLSNTGFETAGGGGADIWANWTETVGDGTIANETTLTHSGSNAAKLTRNTTGAYIQQSFSATAGTAYRFSFWTRGDGTYAGRYAVINDADASILVALTSTGVTGTSYTLVTLTFTAPAGATTITVGLYCPSTTGGIAYFDDVSVKQITTAGLLNGGLEDWTTSTNAATWTETVTGSSTVNREVLSPYSGNCAVRFDVDASNSSLDIRQSVVTSGRTYTVSFYAKADSGTPTIALGGSSAFTTHTLSTTYTLYSGFFTADASYFRVARLSAASKSLYIDNITLISAGPISAEGIVSGQSVNGTRVARYLDQSGNGKHFVQTTPTKRPICTDNGMSAVQTLDFDGVDDVMSNASDVIGTGDITVIAVVLPDSYGGTNLGRILTNGKFQFNVASSNTRLELYSDNATAAYSATNSIVADSTHPYMIVVTRTSAGITNYRINGAASGAANQSSGTPAAGTGTYLGNSTGGGTGFDGDIGDTLIYTAVLTTAQIQMIERYLGLRFGIGV